MRNVLTWPVVFMLVAGCASSPSGPDAGDGPDAATTDAGGDLGEPWDGGQRPDVDPESHLLVGVPEDTAMCTRFSIARDWQQELAMRGQVQLAAGTFAVPRADGAEFEADFVAEVRFGPQRTRLEPEGPGRFEVSHEQGDEPTILLTYRQGFDLQGEPYALSLSVPAGASAEEVVLTPAYMNFRVQGQAVIGPGVDLATELQFLDPCELPRRATGYRLTGESGAELELDRRYCQEPPEFCAGCTMCYFLARAELRLPAEQPISIEDPFLLAYSSMHHNINPVFAVLLDPPAGELAGVLVDNEPCFGGELVFLDADLAELRRETITDCQTVY
ncbi:MAG: hypothetical protein JXR96_08760 [Deltaproteobacteria bacterium]|nr:hypothetical protein [Deltaproteobacteria bacterium]